MIACAVEQYPQHRALGTTSRHAFTHTAPPSLPAALLLVMIWLAGPRFVTVGPQSCWQRRPVVAGRKSEM